jgi:regulator of sigma E protease
MEWYQLLIGVVVGLLLLMAIIIIHELGHAFAARRNGVIVEEFGLGFPPRAKILGKYKGTLITLNWLLPIGGFCKMKGESDAATAKGSYGAANLWSKTQILLAGVTANFLLAIVIFTVLSLFGMPKVFPGQFTMPGDTITTSSPVRVSSVTSDSPASAVGLEQNDEILSIAGEELTSTSRLPEITAEKHGQTIPIEFARNGEIIQKDVTLRDKADGGYLGVSVGQSEFSRSTWSAPIVGVVNTAQFTWWTLEGLGQLIGNFGSGLVGSLSFDESIRENAHTNLSKAGDGVSGPVGILGVIFPNAVMSGAIQLAFISGLISLTLAIMNLLPIPGLDGGRWVLTIIFRIIKKPLTEEIEAKINGIGMVCLFGLLILITTVDILKLW